MHISGISFIFYSKGKTLTVHKGNESLNLLHPLLALAKTLLTAPSLAHIASPA